MSRLHTRVMNLLLVDIVSGTVGEGERLSSEAELAGEFAVSRGVIREALRGLEERGVVRVKHGSGTTVAPEREWNVVDPDVLTAVLETSGRTDVLAEFLEARRLVEIEAAGLAAERATEDDLAALFDALAQTKSSAERAVRSSAAESLFREADLHFHKTIMEATGNRVLARLTEPVRRALFVTQAHPARPELRFQRAFEEHSRIVSAIAARDREAARAAADVHLASVEAMLLNHATSGRRRP